MSSVSLTGNDTVTVNGRILNDFADGDIVKATFPNDLMVVKTGKNGNSIYAFNAPGNQNEVEIRLLRGSADDQFMNNLLQGMRNNIPAFTLMTMELIKNIGNGAGQIIQDISNLTGGVFKKQPDVSDNVEGDVNQAVVTYTLAFSNCERTTG